MRLILAREVGKLLIWPAAVKVGNLLSHRDDDGRLVDDDPQRFGFHNLRHSGKIQRDRRDNSPSDKISSRLFLAVLRPDKTNALHRTYKPLRARRFSPYRNDAIHIDLVSSNMQI